MQRPGHMTRMLTAALLLGGALTARAGMRSPVTIRPDYRGGFVTTEPGRSARHTRPDYLGGYVITQAGRRTVHCRPDYRGGLRCQ